MKFLSLQLLRAVAAIAVIIFHAQALCHRYASHSSHAEALLGNTGAYGVDLFFVLSGYVILHTIHATRTTAQAFLLRRVIRIVPIYWILTLTAVSLPYLVPFAFAQAPIQHTAIQPGPSLPPLQSLAESLLFISYSWHTRGPILYVGWSIEYEMFFYILTSLALLGSLPVYRTLGLLFIGLYALVHCLVPPATASGTVLFFLGDQQIFEFVLGLLVAQIVLREKLTALDVAIPVTALTLTVLLEGAGRFLIAGLPSAVVVWLALRVESRARGYPAVRYLAKVGDASYSIYLLQNLALPGIGKLWAHFVPQLPPDLLVLVATVLVVAGGILVYHWIERPALKGLQRLLLSARAPATPARLGSATDAAERS